MRVFRLTPILIGCCLLAACQAGPGSGKGPASAVPPAPAGTDGAAKPVFLLIPKEMSNTYMRKMYEGFVTACAEFGAEPRFGAVAVNTAQAQIELIDQAVADGNVSAIAVAANDADQLEPALKAAMQAGIQIISLDSAVNRNSRMVHIQQASPEIIGRVLIQATERMTGGEAVVGLISTTPYATNQNLWISWMLQELSDYPEKYKDFHLLPVVYGDDLPDKSKEAALSLLAGHPDLSAIITPSAVSMLAVGRVLLEQGSDVIFTGLGLPSEIAPFIEDGSCPWMYLWNPIDIGYLAAWTAQALYTGEIVGAEGDFFTAGRLGQRVVAGDVDGGTEVLLGDPIKFDKTNIEEWKIVY
ncbi:MAG: substrate-binding domain-containing protein [Clostridiales bacterium]|nr:substrate-binding domain-containing protein [Clostridiales bacterium]